VAVATFTAVARVVTPTVVPTVVPTALKHQNKAIAAAATDLASHLRGVRADKRLFPIPFNRPFLSLAAAREILVVTAKRTSSGFSQRRARMNLLGSFSLPVVTNPGEPKTA
jgi:hypothetical protein